MSLYNMIHGFNPACLVFLPMLNKKYEEYPRFRDCFLSEDMQRIIIYTRVGGNNRDCGYGEEELYALPNFVKTYDDDYDRTYGYYEFYPCDEWVEDFKKCTADKFSEVSDAYVQHVKEFYPTLAAEGVVDKMFRPNAQEDNNVQTETV